MEDERPIGIFLFSAALYAAIAGVVCQQGCNYVEKRMQNIPDVVSETHINGYPWVYSRINSPAKVHCTLRADSLESITD